MTPNSPDGLLEEVAETGFATRQVLSRTELESLQHAYEMLSVPAEHPFYASNVHAQRSTAAEVDRTIKATLHRPLEGLIPGWSPFLAAFISKGSRNGSRVEFHQDWTYTDERRHRALLVWVPLTDVVEDNGALSVVPGSHRWTEGIRPFVTEQPTSALQTAFAKRSRTVPLSAGSGLFYDPALVHGSAPNVCSEVRPVAAIAFAPTGADLVHFRLGPDRHLSGYCIDEGFFTRVEFGQPPDHARGLHPWTRAVEAADFESHLRPR